MATQAERREATQNALLHSALATLMDVGVAGFTTTEVAQRAAKSQGALFRYFPTKNELLAATVEHLFAELRSTYAAQVAELVASSTGAEHPPTIRDAVLLLWDVMSDSRLLAAFDLYTTARTDLELADTIRPVVEAHIDDIHSLGARVLPLIGGRSSRSPGATAWIDLAVNTMQGLAIQELVQPNLDRRLRILDALITDARRVLNDDTPDQGAPR